MCFGYVGVRAQDLRALILDLDGVVTDTAAQHFRAWVRLFDEYLPEKVSGEAARTFSEEDYRGYVDGKPRIDGARSFLRSRGIELDVGSPDDDPVGDTLWGLGNRKDRYYLEILEAEGVEPFPDALVLLRRTRALGIPCAIVSSSRNARTVVKAADLAHFFRASVDGRDLARLELEGKPAPDLFLEAARRLGVDPREAMVVEDARSGVRAGRRGGFGQVIGVARHDEGTDLLRSGADHVVSRLDEIALPTAPIEEST